MEATLCLPSLQEIVTSWSSVKRLGFQFYRSGSANPDLIGVEQFLGAHAHLSFALAGLKLGLEELRLSSRFSCNRDDRARSKDRCRVPEITIPRNAWTKWSSLGNLKTLSLHCDVKLEKGSLAIMVQDAPMLEHFKGIQRNYPWSGICGFELEDLRFISRWKRLRTCVIAVDVRNEDLAVAMPDWKEGNRCEYCQ